MKKQNENLNKLINLLSDGKFHDGSTMGAALGITRSAIWKIVKRLQDYGVNITSDLTKGYRLEQPMTLYDKHKIYNALPISEKKSYELDVFESLNSTNDYLKTLRFKTNKICLAELQTQGKGRFSRTWYSPFGDNIYLSISMSFNQDISELSGLSLVISLAVLNTIEQFYASKNLSIKWPNDVLLNGKKIAGILIEGDSEVHGCCKLIIGIGLNVNMTDKKANQHANHWTSIKLATKKNIDKNQITASLLNNLFKYIKKFQDTGFGYFQSEWKKYDYLYGQEITITNGKKRTHGICRGVNNQGYLQVEKSDGTNVQYLSGDTSLNHHS